MGRTPTYRWSSTASNAPATHHLLASLPISGPFNRVVAPLPRTSSTDCPVARLQQRPLTFSRLTLLLQPNASPSHRRSSRQLRGLRSRLQVFELEQLVALYECRDIGVQHAQEHVQRHVVFQGGRFRLEGSVRGRERG